MDSKVIRGLLWAILVFAVIVAVNTCSMNSLLLRGVPLACEPEYVVPNNVSMYVDTSSEYYNELVVAVNDSASRHKIDVNWLWAILYQEGCYHHYTSNGSIKRGNSGELGVAQILPDAMKIKKAHDLYSLEGNIDCAAELLAYGLQESGDMWKATGWYNTGAYCTNGYTRSVEREYVQQTESIQ